MDGVTDPTGTFTLSIQRDFNPTTFTYDVETTGPISYNSDAVTFASKLDNIGFWNKWTWGVSAEAFDVDGNSVPMSDPTATKFVWTVAFGNVRSDEED